MGAYLRIRWRELKLVMLALKPPTARANLYSLHVLDSIAPDLSIEVGEVLYFLHEELLAT
jgi:hypothetical protein